MILVWVVWWWMDEWNFQVILSYNNHNKHKAKGMQLRFSYDGYQLYNRVAMNDWLNVNLWY